MEISAAASGVVPSTFGLMLLLWQLKLPYKVALAAMTATLAFAHFFQQQLELQPTTRVTTDDNITWQML